MNYEKAYFILFNAITAAIDEIKKSSVVSQEMILFLRILENAQIKTEGMYISEE